MDRNVLNDIVNILCANIEKVHVTNAYVNMSLVMNI